MCKAILPLLALTLGIIAPRPASADDKPEHPEMWMFDTKPITATSPGPGKTSFKITDRIYARVFFDRSIKDVFGFTPTKYSFRVYQKQVDSGSNYNNVEIWVPKKNFADKWIDLEILPDPATAKTKFGADGLAFHWTWINAVADNKALKGPHEVMYKIVTGSPFAEPDRRLAIITIDFTGLDAKKLKAEVEKVAAAGDKAFASNFGVPKPGRLHSAALAQQAEAMTKKGNRDVVAVKVIFTGDGWEIEKDDKGKIVERYAEAAVVTKAKGGVCHLDDGIIKQAHTGGSYRAMEWGNTAGTPAEIDCKKAFR